MFENVVGRVVEAGRVDFLHTALEGPSAGEIVLRVRCSAVCGSDKHIFKGRHPSVPLPATIGHEFSGDVAAVGEGVRGFAPGDRATVEPCITCGECEACRRGDYGYCENITFTYRAGAGAMARYVKVRADRAYRLPEYMSFEAGALIEPLAVAVHAVRRANITLGENVAVIGGGAIGLLIAALCRLSGAGQTLVIDTSEKRLALARELGATETVLSHDAGRVMETARRISGGRKMDKTFECVGKPAAFVQAMELLKKNGLATIVGIFEEPEFSIPVMRFITDEIRVQGAQGYCWDFPIALEMAQRIPLEKLITHRFPLSDLQKALETSLDRGAGSVKILVEP
jgi:2-desacetyl-2-hydroxyethyl bacteriochlorophyllide A dehydrogenase